MVTFCTKWSVFSPIFSAGAGALRSRNAGAVVGDCSDPQCALGDGVGVMAWVVPGGTPNDCSYGPLPVISTYNPIYNMYNPTYNQL